MKKVIFSLKYLELMQNLKKLSTYYLSNSCQLIGYFIAIFFRYFSLKKKSVAVLCINFSAKTIEKTLALKFTRLINTYYLLPIVWLFLSVSPTFGQKQELPAHVTWGQELKEPSKTYIDKIITANKQGIITLRQKHSFLESFSKIYVEKYDASLNLKHSQKIDLKYKKKKLQFEELLNLNGNLYLLTSFNNKAKEKTYLFSQKLNKRFIPAKKPIKIAEIETGSWIKEGSFDLEISKDSSKILVYGQLPYQRKQSERFNLSVLDKQLQPIWDRNIILPYSDQLLSIENYKVDNQGNVYILGKLRHEKARLFQNKTPNYHYIILAYSANKDEATEYKIDLKDKFITDLTFRPSNDGNLICAGFYSEKLSYSIKGTCFFNMDMQTKEAFNIHLKKFDFDFLTEYMSDRRKEKAKRAEESGNKRRSPELYRYALDDLILRSDGGAVLVGEQYYIEERKSYYRDGSYRSTYYYNYNDIIVVNIKPSGEIEWATHIPKRQRTQDDGGYYSSYAKAVVRDKIYFIYNDNRRNFSEKESTRKRKRIHYFDGRYSIVALAEVKKDGSLTSWPLFSNRDVEIITRPKISRQTGSKKMIVYGERGKKYRFAKLFFTE